MEYKCLITTIDDVLQVVKKMLDCNVLKFLYFSILGKQ